MADAQRAGTASASPRRRNMTASCMLLSWRSSGVLHNVKWTHLGYSSWPSMPTLWAADNHAAPLHLLLYNAAIVCDQLRTAWCWWLSCLGQHGVSNSHIPMRVHRRGSKAVCLQCHTSCCTQALQSASELACTLASDASATQECLLSMIFSETNILHGIRGTIHTPSDVPSKCSPVGAKLTE